MSFLNDLNYQNILIQSQQSKKELFTPNKSPFSDALTSFSSKDLKKDQELNLNEDSKLLKPTPTYPFPLFEPNISSENSNLNNLKKFNEFLDNIRLASIKEMEDGNFKTCYIGKKRKGSKELQIDNNYPKNEKAQEDFNINKSAFKKVEINNKFNMSAFGKNIKYMKMKTIKKNHKKTNMINKIIINETNNLKENIINNKSTNQPKLKKLFKSIKLDEKDENEEINNKFNVIKKRRRGRKPRDEIFKKRVHDAYDYDNILRKIQVHFLTFIISFSNDLIGSFSSNNKDLKFKNLSYNLKKVVKHSYVETLKKCKIGDILQFQASSKNKKSEVDVNKQIFEKVCDLYPCLKIFFDMCYLDLFNQYYYKSNKVICFEGKNIILSKNTRVFSDLLAKNKKASEKIQEVAFRNFGEYFNNDNKQTIFIVKK